MAFDFNEILARLTILDILENAGYHPRRNRMACFICDSDNPTTLSFKNHTFYCFKCGARGGLLDLIQYLNNCNAKESLKIACGLANVKYPEPKPRRRWDIRKALKEAKILSKRLPDINEKLFELQQIVTALKLLHECIPAYIHIIKKAIKLSRIGEAKALTLIDWCIYILGPETDEQLIFYTNKLHQMEKQNG